MIDKIINILEKELEDCETQSGIKGRIIWEEDFGIISKTIAESFGYSDKALADCGETDFYCDFRRKDKCHSIKECSLKMEIT